MSRARPSVYVPSRLPGNERLRFLPSAGTTNGERCRNDSRETTGTAVIVPESSEVSSSRMTLVTAAIELYSQPWMPAISESRGPSVAPSASKHGCSRPASRRTLRRIMGRTLRSDADEHGSGPARPHRRSPVRERPAGRGGRRRARGGRAGGAAGGGRGADLAALGDRRGLPGDRLAGRAGAGAAAGADGRRRAQRL